MSDEDWFAIWLLLDWEKEEREKEEKEKEEEEEYY
jgi:hypothetical protein